MSESSLFKLDHDWMIPLSANEIKQVREFHTKFYKDGFHINLEEARSRKWKGIMVPHEYEIKSKNIINIFNYMLSNFSFKYFISIINEGAINDESEYFMSKHSFKFKIEDINNYSNECSLFNFYITNDKEDFFIQYTTEYYAILLTNNMIIDKLKSTDFQQKTESFINEQSQNLHDKFVTSIAKEILSI